MPWVESDVNDTLEGAALWGELPKIVELRRHVRSRRRWARRSLANALEPGGSGIGTHGK
jgi:hypothetical protein